MVKELKMLRFFFLGVTRTDKVRKARLTMLGHVQWINWMKDVSDGAVRQDKKKDLRLHACSERGLKDRGGW